MNLSVEINSRQQVVLMVVCDEVTVAVECDMDALYGGHLDPVLRSVFGPVVVAAFEGSLEYQQWVYEYEQTLNEKTRVTEEDF